MKESPRFHQSSAFSLIEMLVVIGIIGALAAMILPAVGYARERSRRTSCLSNLRQIGAGLALYADTFKEYMPSCPTWHVNTAAFTVEGQTVKNFPGHQGISRLRAIGLGDELADPESVLKGGRLNFVPAGLGFLVWRSMLSTEVLACPSMRGPNVPTWYGPAKYEYTPAFPRHLAGGDLVLGDGRRLPHVATFGTLKTTAVISSYAYRNAPFYTRSKPRNAPTGWVYVADHPSLADFSNPSSPWIAEWNVPGERQSLSAQFMAPPFKTVRRLGSRPVAADAFDFAPRTNGAFPFGQGLAQWHHTTGYNVLFGDGHAEWYEDHDKKIALWHEWEDETRQPGTDNLTISSLTAQRVWDLFGQ